MLNAKQHEREAQIVLDAGRPGMVTIATNMAGRGTDIVLGGGINKAVGAIEADETLSAEEKAQRIAEVKSQWQKLHDEVVAAGGLRIIGSERHESRRIDNQLRGRAGRQATRVHRALSVDGRSAAAHFRRRPYARHRRSAQA